MRNGSASAWNASGSSSWGVWPECSSTSSRAPGIRSREVLPRPPRQGGEVHRVAPQPPAPLIAGGVTVGRWSSSLAGVPKRETRELAHWTLNMR